MKKQHAPSLLMKKKKIAQPLWMSIVTLVLIATTTTTTTETRWGSFAGGSLPVVSAEDKTYLSIRRTATTAGGSADSGSRGLSDVDVDLNLDGGGAGIGGAGWKAPHDVTLSVSRSVHHAQQYRRKAEQSNVRTSSSATTHTKYDMNENDEGNPHDASLASLRAGIFGGDWSVADVRQRGAAGGHDGVFDLDCADRTWAGFPKCFSDRKRGPQWLGECGDDHGFGDVYSVGGDSEDGCDFQIGALCLWFCG